MRWLRKVPKRPAVAAAGVLVAAALLSACGSSTTATTTTSNPTTTTKPQPHIRNYSPCTASLLQFVPSFGGAAAGGSYYRVKVTNISPNACAVDGYPGLTFFAPNAAGGTSSGVVVPLTVTPAGPAPTKLILSHEQSAEFLLLYTDVPVNGGACTSVASMNVKPPNQTYSAPVPITFDPCGGEVKVYAFAAPGTLNP